MHNHVFGGKLGLHVSISIDYSKSPHHDIVSVRLISKGVLWNTYIQHIEILMPESSVNFIWPLNVILGQMSWNLKDHYRLYIQTLVMHGMHHFWYFLSLLNRGLPKTTSHWRHYQVETDRAFTYARRSTYGMSIDVRFSPIFHGLMAVIKAYFAVDKSSIT